jgi:mitochondrial intermediate peptidase
MNLFIRFKLILNIKGIYFVIRSITSRRRLANLCGFETFSHRANLNAILDKPTSIMAFLNECAELVKPKANKELDMMRKFKLTRLNSNQPLAHYDVPYVSSQLKKLMFELDGSRYTEYFSLGGCMEGINLILNHLYK